MNSTVTDGPSVLDRPPNLLDLMEISSDRIWDDIRRFDKQQAVPLVGHAKTAHARDSWQCSRTIQAASYRKFCTLQPLPKQKYDRAGLSVYIVQSDTGISLS